MPQNPVDQLALFGPEVFGPEILEASTGLNYGWMGQLAEFLDLPLSTWLKTVSANYQALYQQRATQTQQQAWQDCGEILQSQLSQLRLTRPDCQTWTLIFEYELPREGGRRPDLVMLAAGQILVFEFKQKARPSQADRDQVLAYARDLKEYHRASHGHVVTPILVLTRRTGLSKTAPGETGLLNPTEISGFLQQLSPDAEIDPQAWVQSDYAPLPTVIQAARRIFQQEPLPEIRLARSAGIPALLDYLNQLVITAQTQQQRHLVLITGVPGAGKTLVGLQLVYRSASEQTSEQISEQTSEQAAVFLSGNGPLITVLQYALKSKVFVQAVRNFYLQYEVRQQSAPAEHLIVFDEAQRAWDAERMAEKYGIASAAAGAVLRIANRLPNWCLVVGLIGEGQEIHVGEEEGIEQWNQGLLELAPESRANWYVHCAPSQSEFFTGVPAQRLTVDRQFNLTHSLRSHLARDLQIWVAHLLAGEFGPAALLMPQLRQAGFDAYITRDLAQAKAYCTERYPNQPQKRYGLMASSRAGNLAAYGIPNGYQATARLNVGAWYVDPPDSPQSCCALERAVTEFGCQGLELDLPIVGWGDDLRWDERAWFSTTRQRHVKNPLRLRLNSYRVLLTRGRDGFVVFVPPEAKMDSTYEALQSAGLELLSQQG